MALPDNQHALSGSADNAVKLFNVKDGAVLRTFRHRGDERRALAGAAARRPPLRPRLAGQHDADQHVAAGRVEPRGARMERAAERRELLSHGLEKRGALHAGAGKDVHRRRRRRRRNVGRRLDGRADDVAQRVGECPPPTARRGRRRAGRRIRPRARVRRCGAGGRYSTSMLAPAATGSASAPLSESDARSGALYDAADGSGAAPRPSWRAPPRPQRRAPAAADGATALAPRVPCDVAAEPAHVELEPLARAHARGSTPRRGVRRRKVRRPPSSAATSPSASRLGVVRSLSVNLASPVALEGGAIAAMALPWRRMRASAEEVPGRLRDSLTAPRMVTDVPPAVGPPRG